MVGQHPKNGRSDSVITVALHHAADTAGEARRDSESPAEAHRFGSGEPRRRAHTRGGRCRHECKVEFGTRVAHTGGSCMRARRVWTTERGSAVSDHVYVASHGGGGVSAAVGLAAQTPDEEGGVWRRGCRTRPCGVRGRHDPWRGGKGSIAVRRGHSGRSPRGGGRPRVGQDPAQPGGTCV